MANKYYSDVTPSKQTGGQGASNAPQGSGARNVTGREGTANWPGLPGKGGPDRSGGTKRTGFAGGQFEVKRAGY